MTKGNAVVVKSNFKWGNLSTLNSTRRYDQKMQLERVLKTIIYQESTANNIFPILLHNFKGWGYML